MKQLFPRLTRPSLAALAFTLAFTLACSAAAQAGHPCETKPPTLQTITRGLALAERTQAALEAEFARSGAQVAVLARAGQDLTKYGVHWSHLGWAYRTNGPGAQPTWRVVHKLNRCGSAEAAIHRQGLAEFFLDDLWRFEAAWAVPTPEVQQRLLPMLDENARAVALHHKPYSVVSYAWGQTYQQSNQWAVETLAAAMAPEVVAGAGITEARQRAQAWLRLKGYAPASLHIDTLTRLGGRLSAANVAFDDHPGEQRFANRIDTVTADSVLRWLERGALAGPVRQVQSHEF